jgi:dihydrofolate reductase
VDTVILGKRTYDWVMTQVNEFPHANKETYVITRNNLESIGNTIFYSGDLDALIIALKQKKGGNIFIDGGAFVVNELLKNKRIDEFIISIIPVLLGAGTRLFDDKRQELLLDLVSEKSFAKGLVQLHYRKL